MKKLSATQTAKVAWHKSDAHVLSWNSFVHHVMAFGLSSLHSTPKSCIACHVGLLTPIKMTSLLKH